MSNYEQIYLFTGTDEVRKKSRMDRIITSIENNNEKIDIIKYDAEEISLSKILSEAITIPFLCDLKVIIIKKPLFLTNKGSDKNDYSRFIKYLKKPVDTTVLIIDATNLEIDQKNEIYQILKKVAYIIDTKELDDVEYKAWVQRYFAKENVDITNDALFTLSGHVKRNLVRMEQEIQKLVSYVGPGGKVTEEIVKNLVCKDLDGDIFDFTKAIINKDRTKAYQYYLEFSHNTQDVGGLTYMVAKTFIELLTTLKLLRSGYSQSDISEILNIKSGRAYYLVRDAKTFKMEILEEYVKKCALLDYQVKTGMIDKKLGLEMLLLEI